MGGKIVMIWDSHKKEKHMVQLNYDRNERLDKWLSAEQLVAQPLEKR